MANRAYRINISGIGGFIFLAGLIVLGFLTLTFFFIFIGIIIAVLLVRFLIRKILFSLRIKKEVKVTDVEYYTKKMIEIPAYKVEDDEESIK